jgi:hypothetical protein
MEFIIDRSNGKSKGCVLVEFGDPMGAARCKEELQGWVIVSTTHSAYASTSPDDKSRRCCVRMQRQQPVSWNGHHT